MKLQWASSLLLGLAARSVDADSASDHLPDFALDSSHLHMKTSGPIDPEALLFQSRPWGGSLLPRNQFTAHCSSVAAGSRCEHVQDGLAETSWTSEAHKPHEADELLLDLHTARVVNGLTVRFLPGEQDRGQVAKHSVYVSVDGTYWANVAFGTWGWTRAPKLSVFEPVEARYVKLVATSEAPPPKDTSRRYPDAFTTIVDVNVYTTTATIPQEKGQGVWGPTIDMPITAAAGAHGFRTLADGSLAHSVMLWSAWSDDRFFASPGGKTFTTTYDPYARDLVSSNVTNTYHDMFCPGIAMDGDGNVIVSGGGDAQKTSIYEHGEWVPGPDMNLHRGYHSTTTLSDGKVFAIGGSWSGGSNGPKNGEVYDPAAQRWRILEGVPADVIHTIDIPYRRDSHPWLFGWSDGSVFHAGPSNRMFWFDTHGDGDWKNATRRLNDQDSTSGNAVMFDAARGKIVAFGGQAYYDGSFGHRNAHVITIKHPFRRPQVAVAGLNGTSGVVGMGGMFRQRVYHTSVVLPDGTVFITGGNIFGSPFNEHPRDVQLTPEIYHPEWDIFLPLQTNNVVRVYHSLSMLLPDATVLNGGGGLCGNCTANHYDAQIFTPPYLLREDGTPAERPSTPQIVDNKYRVQVGGTIAFAADEDIKSVALIRLGSVSHTVNTDQRRIPLQFALAGETDDCDALFHASVPEDSGVALPGYYMMFVLNEKGVPSHAATVKVELSKTQQASSPKHKSPLSTVEDDEEAEEDVEEAHMEDCDLETKEMDDEEAQGMMKALYAALRKLWGSRKTGLVHQA